MTASGRYASPDSSFGRSTGNAAARGGALIAVAVVIGFLLLWQGGVGGSGTAAEVSENDGADAQASEDDASNDDDQAATEDNTENADDGAADDGSADGTTEDPATETTTTTTVAAALRPNGEVRAAVANGTDTSGLAGSRSGELGTAGYATAAVNAANNTAVSNVYYIADYGNEAEQVAILLGGDASVLRPATAEELASLVREDNQAQIEGFHILVVLGTDQVLG